MTNQVDIFKQKETEKQRFLYRTYTFMGLALLVSAVCAFLTAAENSPVLNLLLGNKALGFKIVAISEIALVFVFSLLIRKLSPFMAAVIFFVYAILNGVTLSTIFLIYNSQSIIYAFLATSILFFLMSMFGALTKTSLSKAGHYLRMMLLGVILVSGINLIVQMITKIQLNNLDWIISIVTVIIFTGLTAVDTQKILQTAESSTDSDDYKKLAIYGALELYLDFINIFLRLLSLFGRKK